MSKTSETIRVLLADDHPVAREGIRAILERAPDIQIVGEAKDGLEAKWMVADLCLDILLLELVMPGPRPSEIEAWVRTHYPETITLVLTAHNRDDYLAAMVEVGAAGFVVEEEAPETVVEAVRRAGGGVLQRGATGAGALLARGGRRALGEFDRAGTGGAAASGRGTG